MGCFRRTFVPCRGYGAAWILHAAIYGARWVTPQLISACIIHCYFFFIFVFLNTDQFYIKKKIQNFLHVFLLFWYLLIKKCMTNICFFLQNWHHFIPKSNLQTPAKTIDRRNPRLIYLLIQSFYYPKTSLYKFKFGM